MAEVYQRPEPFNVPDGGLATFLTATEGSWADDFEDKYPDVGIGAIKEAADSLAKFGRHEDEYMVHAAEGETVIPKEILDRDPRLKARLFKQMRDMGVDPERYIVGNELNSINPVTGQPEFFLKKFGKFVKRAVKKVVGVLKKAAPIVLSTAINFIAPGLGTAVTGALGAGLGSLVQGKSLKESFNAALMGGAAGALAGGIGGLGTEKGFMGGVKDAFNVNDVFKGQNILQKTLGSKEQGAVTGRPSGAIQQGSPPLKRPFGQNVAETTSSLNLPDELMVEPFGSKTTSSLNLPDELMVEPFGSKNIIPVPKQVDPSSVTFNIPQQVASNVSTQSPSFLDKLKTFYLEKISPNRASLPDDATLLRQYGPLFAAGTGVMALAGGFDTPKTKSPEGFDRKQYPPLRVGFPLRPGAMQNPYYPGYPYEPMQAAKGGEMEFPRRTGGISGPGTGTSDDIPAMLSDGEFVMTAKAVRGAGNGSRKEGVRRMYDMMRTFEGGTA
jgi:hypothetical protein